MKLLRIILTPLRWLLNAGPSDEIRGLVIQRGYYTDSSSDPTNRATYLTSVNDWRTGAPHEND